MQDLILNQTPLTPRIEFYANGNLKMDGRSLPENVEMVYTPIINWIIGLKAEKVNFDINLEYFNSASSKKIMEILKHLDANNSIKQLNINWHYEEGDDDSVEIAQIYEESLLRVSFKYIEYEEAA
jgi:sulfatase maturation enzyme AslB (radical SAM superfamily)